MALITNNPGSVSAAIDISYLPAKFAIAITSKSKNNQPDLHIFSSEKLSDGFALLSFIENSLKALDLNFNDISDWTIGTGPGAFSQLRMLSATVLGMTFGKEVKLRGIPSGAAFASTIAEENISYNVLYPLSGKNLAFCVFEKKSSNCKLIKAECLHSIDDIPCENRKTIIHHSSLEKNPEIEKIPFCEIRSNYPVEGLLEINPDNWEADSVKALVYTRPPAKLPQNA